MSILVTYATHFGSTQEIAETIADTLRQRNLEVKCHPVENVNSLDSYTAVVMGSAVEYGKWLPTALEFVEKHQSKLAELPMAIFSVHIQNQGDDLTSTRNREAYLDAIKPLLNPVASEFFAGRTSRRSLQALMPNWLARFMPTVDHRKWEKIRTWANDIATQLQPEAV